MFHSNQKLDITTEFKNLNNVITFAINMYNEGFQNNMFTRPVNTVHMAFAEPVPGIYAIGTGSMDSSIKMTGHGYAKGWTNFQFDFDPEIIARIIEQWARKQNYQEYVDTDGSAILGIRVRSLESLRESIPELHRCYDSSKWEPSKTILTFTPTMLLYNK